MIFRILLRYIHPSHSPGISFPLSMSRATMLMMRTQQGQLRRSSSFRTKASEVMHWFSSRCRSGYCRFSSRFTFCWNFLRSNSCKRRTGELRNTYGIRYAYWLCHQRLSRGCRESTISHCSCVQTLYCRVAVQAKSSLCFKYFWSHVYKISALKAPCVVDYVMPFSAQSTSASSCSRQTLCPSRHEHQGTWLEQENS